MHLDREALYRALRTRDARFDGRIFVGVRTTGIYCRPICPARTPKLENVEFYASAAAAQEAGFRPCLRCRPESSPDLAAWRGTSSTVARALGLIAEGALDGDDADVEGLALRLGIGERQLRRLFTQHLGRIADRGRADPAGAVREAADPRDPHEHDGRRRGGGLRERPSFQRDLPRPLWALTVGAAARVRRRRRQSRSGRGDHAQAQLRAALRLGRDDRVPRGPRDRGRGGGPTRSLSPHDRPRRRAGDDRGRAARRPRCARGHHTLPESAVRSRRSWRASGASSISART